MLRRVNCRAQAAVTERKLAKAEENLGLLGWQQADFDEATQRQVDSLQNIEREQANLTNRSAELAHEIARLSEHRVKYRGEYDQQRTTLEGERHNVRHPLADLSRRLHTVRDNTPDVDRRTAQLDRELKEVEDLSMKLLVVQPQPMHVRDELMRLRERTLTIQNERNDIRTQHARSLSEIHHLEQQIATIEKRVTELDKNLRELKTQFEEEDGKLAGEERQLVEEKETAEKDVNHLERAKENPYRAIGRVLADNAIAPMNQPAALANVLNLREKVAQKETELAALFAETRALDPTQFWISVGLWVVVIVAGLLVIAAVL